MCSERMVEALTGHLDLEAEVGALVRLEAQGEQVRAVGEPRRRGRR